jgi:hypothetical protein
VKLGHDLDPSVSTYINEIYKEPRQETVGESCHCCWQLPEGTAQRDTESLNCYVFLPSEAGRITLRLQVKRLPVTVESSSNSEDSQGNSDSDSGHDTIQEIKDWEANAHERRLFSNLPDVGC